MRCHTTYRDLSAYLDQELTTREREAIASHLKACRACAKEIQALAESRLLLSQAPRFVAPPGFSHRLLAKLEPTPPPNRALVLLQQGLNRALVLLQQGLNRALLTPFLVRFAEAAVILLMIGIGVVSGRLLVPTTELSGPGPGVALLSLDLFDPAPPGSLGGVYLAMTEGDHEK